MKGWPLAMAMAAATLLEGCAYHPRFLTAWYAIDASPGATQKVVILLVNHGRTSTRIYTTRLNNRKGPDLKDMSYKPGDPLPVGGSLRFPVAPYVQTDRPGCLPIRLFVSLRNGEEPRKRIEIPRPLPTSVDPDPRVACPPT